MASHQKSSRLASRLPSSTTTMSFCYSAGKKGLCPKICVMQTSSPHTRIRVTTATTTITVSLLSIVRKAFTHMVLNRLEVCAEHVYPEAQCGFRAGRSTLDMIFSLCQLQEKCHKQRQLLYIPFIDLTKAFDLVSIKGFFTADDSMSP